MSLWLVVLFVSCTFAAQGGCDFGDVLSNGAYTTLITRIHAQSFTPGKIQVLTAFAANNTVGITSNQTVGILKEFAMSDDKLKAINTVQNFILTLECSGIVSIIKPLSFSRTMMDALRVVISLANEADLKLYNETIVQVFSMSDDKAEARRIIANAKPRSCLFGPANIPLFAFVIDVSGSMADTFRDADGVVYSRLGYVQRDLKNVMNGTLKSTQQFNIIAFSDRAAAWQPGVVPANASNIASAGTYVQNLRAAGGTYVQNALKLAFSDPKVLGLYFLSDGAPSDNGQAAITYAQSVGKPVHTIAFKAPTGGQDFLWKLANATKASFRNIVP